MRALYIRHAIHTHNGGRMAEAARNPRGIIRRMSLPPSMLRAMVRVSGALPGTHPLRQRTEEALEDGQVPADWVLPPPPSHTRQVAVAPALVPVQPKAGRIGESATCSVCLGEYEEGQPCLMLPCTHAYHSECILPWLRVNPTCPMCRTEL